MKRMSEVFKLPVEVNQVYVSPNLIEYGKMDDAVIRDVLTYAAHAINHVDALADALTELVKSSSGFAVAHSPEYKKAVETLAAFWGAK